MSGSPMKRKRDLMILMFSLRHIDFAFRGSELLARWAIGESAFIGAVQRRPSRSRALGTSHCAFRTQARLHETEAIITRDSHIGDKNPANMGRGQKKCVAGMVFRQSLSLAIVRPWNQTAAPGVQRIRPKQEESPLPPPSDLQDVQACLSCLRI